MLQRMEYHGKINTPCFRGQVAACLLTLIGLAGTALAEPVFTSIWPDAEDAARPDWQRHFDFSHPQSGIDLFASQIREIASHGLFSHEFAPGVKIDAGFSRSRDLDASTVSPAAGRFDYQDLFVGIRFRGLGGRAWRLDPRSSREAGAGTRWYYEAGMERRLTDNWSVSLQLGSPLDGDLFTSVRRPDLSLGARYRYRGFDLGLRVIEHGQRATDETSGGGFSFMGSVSHRFP